MGWEMHSARADFAHYSGDWDRLNTELYQGHPFFDSRFVGPLLDCFGDGRELLCLDHEDGIVRGALIVHPEGGGRWAVFRPSQTQASAILIDDAARFATLLAALPGWAWTLELYAVDPRYAPDFLRCQLPQMAHAHARTIGVDASLSFADYWDKRSKNLKANVRRYFNRAEKEAATPQLLTVDDPAAMASAVARFGELETAGWKGAAGTAVSIDNRQGEFYAEVLRCFALAGKAAVHELYVGEQLAASRLVVGSERMLIILKTAYDESLARFAPGRVLLYRVIEQQRARHPEQTIEFYTNATRDQFEWASFDCVIQNVQLFRNESCVAAFSTLKAIRHCWRSARNRQPHNDNELLTPTVTAHSRLDDELAPAADGVEGSGRVTVLDLGDFRRGTALENSHETSPETSLETSLDWFALLQRTVFPDDPRVHYFCASESRRVKAILPLRHVKHGLIRGIEALGNFYTYLYAPLFAADADRLALNPLIAAATRVSGGTHMMRFSPLDPQSRDYTALLRALRSNDWIPLPFFCFGNWFHPAEASWEDYLKGRGRNLRSSIKRRTTRFTAAGGSVEIVSAREQVDLAIAAFQEIYSASWKRPEPYAQFVPSLIALLAERGMLRLGIARLGERTIAAQLWIVEHGKASIFKVAYHRDYAAHSPGTVLTAHLFRHVIENDHVGEIDFLIGDDKYKRIWMSDRRERWGIVAYNPRALIGLMLCAKEVAGRLAKAAVRRLRGAVMGTGSRPTVNKP